MKNVELASFENNNGKIEYFFQIHSNIADYVRKTTNYSSEDLLAYLDEKNLFRYVISSSDDFSELHDLFIRTVERISNSGDNAFFCNHLITDNGHHRSPSEIHALMHKEYGLADINKVDDEDSYDTDIDLEWWVAHFFISFGNMIFDNPLPPFENSKEIPAQPMNITPDISFVSEFLEALKKIDHIVIVDDASKISPEEMKEIHDSLRIADESNDIKNRR